MEQQPNNTPSPAPSPPKKKPPIRRKRRRPSPVPVSMWLLPRLRLPFASPAEFLRWFLTGINFWAVGAVLLCAFLGWNLLERFAQPRQLGVEQALAGAKDTAGLTYLVEQTGESEVTVTGRWDEEKEQQQPSPRLAAALCAALSPEEIYGHSNHLYRSIASRFFEGEDFDLTISLRRAMTKEDQEEPEPIFTITRRAGMEDWPQPDCSSSFAREWRAAYSEYWLFGQGRKEEMGPPQSDPIFEEGDRPPESQGEEEDGEEAPPLPDLEGDGSGPEDGSSGEGSGESGESGQEGEDDPADSPPGEDGPPPPGEGEGEGEDAPPPEDWLGRLLHYASRYRGLSWEEAWELFRQGEDASSGGAGPSSGSSAERTSGSSSES